MWNTVLYECDMIMWSTENKCTWYVLHVWKVKSVIERQRKMIWMKGERDINMLWMTWMKEKIDGIIIWFEIDEWTWDVLHDW